MLWDVGNTGGYDDAIAGIGRDAAFYQKQSRPENGLELLTAGAGGMVATTNALNPTVLTEGSYLLWGSNGGVATSFTNLGGAAQKMNRQWRIREVGETGLLKLQYPSVILNFASGQYAYLCVSSDATFDLNDTFIEMTLNNGAYEANYNFTEGQYFSFAKVFLCATPHFSMASVPATCLNGVASSYAGLALQTKDNATVKLGYSIGGTYAGGTYAGATTVGAMPFTLANTLMNANPQQGIYNSANKLWNVGALGVGSKTLTVTVKMN